MHSALTEPNAERSSLYVPGRATAKLPAWLPLALLTLVGAALRFLGLDWQSMWLDEVSSLRNAHAFGRGGFLALARVDQIAPLHSIVLWISSSLFGDTSFASRLPSVLAGIAAIPLIYAVAWRMFGSRRIALISAVLVCVSPFSIWFSQDGRMYALLLVAALAYVAVAWPMVSRALTFRELLLLLVITTVGLGMHHYMALLVLSFGFFLLIKDRGITRRSWAWAATQIIAAGIFAYWMVLTADTLDNAAGNPKPALVLWAPYSFYTFVAGFSYGPSARELAIAGRNIVGQVLNDPAPIVILALATTLLVVMGGRKSWRSASSEAGLWLGIWLVGPVLLAVVATLATHISFNVRYVIISFPAIMIMIARGLADLPWAGVFKRTLRTNSGADAGSLRLRGADIAGIAAAGVLVVCLTIADLNLYFNPRYAKEDTRSLARFLQDMPPGTHLVADNQSVSKMLRFYRTAVPSRSLQVDYRFTSRNPQEIWRNVQNLPAGSANELWLIEYRSWQSDPEHFLRSRLDSTRSLIGVRTWPGVTLRRYRSDAVMTGAVRREFSKNDVRS